MLADTRLVVVLPTMSAPQVGRNPGQLAATARHWLSGAPCRRLLRRAETRRGRLLRRTGGAVTRIQSVLVLARGVRLQALGLAVECRGPARLRLRFKKAAHLGGDGKLVVGRRRSRGRRQRRRRSRTAWRRLTRRLQ
eukprot:5899445-Pleurochrysis_carterae.AAC.2